MSIPNITEADVARAFPDLENIHYVTHGGQKVVFSCEREGTPFILKFLLAGIPPLEDSVQTVEVPAQPLDVVTSRARREVDTMAKCDVHTLVKLGPIPLGAIEISGQPLLYFSEERIDGKDLRRILEDEGPLPIDEVLRLARDVTIALDAIWRLRRIHRDVKPSNIMRKYDTGDFVLLDVGLVFDLDDTSLTPRYHLPGTAIYFSPEQMDYTRRRQLDFRSDLFALGIVLYEATTGQHPFTQNCTSREEVWDNIAHSSPIRPNILRPEIPEELEGIILRLLQKPAHLRYRNCKQLIQQLETVQVTDDGGLR